MSPHPDAPPTRRRSRAGPGCPRTQVWRQCRTARKARPAAVPAGHPRTHAQFLPDDRAPRLSAT